MSHQSTETVEIPQYPVLKLAKEARSLPSDFVSFVRPYNIVLEKKHYLIIMILIHKTKSVDYLIDHIGWTRSRYKYILAELRQKFNCKRTTELIASLLDATTSGTSEFSIN